MDVALSDGVPDLSWLAESPMFIDGQQIALSTMLLLGLHSGLLNCRSQRARLSSWRSLLAI
jgi:hypothetical protein